MILSVRSARPSKVIRTCGSVWISGLKEKSMWKKVRNVVFSFGLVITVVFTSAYFYHRQDVAAQRMERQTEIVALATEATLDKLQAERTQVLQDRLEAAAQAEADRLAQEQAEAEAALAAAQAEAKEQELADAALAAATARQEAAAAAAAEAKRQADLAAAQQAAQKLAAQKAAQEAASQKAAQLAADQAAAKKTSRRSRAS